MFGRKKSADLERFVAYETQELGHSQETGLTYERMLRSGAEKLGKEIWDVSVADVRALMARSELSWRWKSLFVSAIKAYRRWGELEGLWEMNGFAAVRAPKQQFAEEEKVPVSDETARRLIESAQGSTETRIVFLGLFQGLRLNEATTVEFQPTRLKVFGKGGRIRYAPIHSQVEKVRDLILETPPANKSTLRTAFKRVQKRTQARDVDGKIATPHSLRHTFSTHLTAKRVIPDYIDQAMGHSRGTRGVYSDIPWEIQQETIETVDYYTGEPVQLSFGL